MITRTLTALALAAAPVPAFGAVVAINSATFVQAPAGDGSGDDPQTITSFIAGGSTFTNLAGATAENVNSGQFATPGELDAPFDQSDNERLSGLVATDGVGNINANARLNFGRPLTADEVFFILEFETESQAGTAAGRDQIDLVAIDGSNNATSETLRVTIGDDDVLLTFDTSTRSNDSLFGSIFSVSDFTALAPGSLAATQGLRVVAGNGADTSVFGIASVPEPASLGLMAAGLGLLASRRRR